MRSDETGSITVYCALMMCVLVPLFFAAIVSVKVQAGRMQAANSVDQALYSLFARYDRQIMEKYDLFFLNAGKEGSEADLGSCIALIEEDMEYILKPNKGRWILGGKNLLRLKRESGAVTGCTLATDAGGIPFEAQAVQAMKDTGIPDAINMLKEKLTDREAAEEAGKPYAGLDPMESYKEVEAAAEQAKAEREAAEEEAAELGYELPEEEPAVEIPEGFINPIPALFRFFLRKLMDAVVPDPKNISKKKVDKIKLVSGRTLARGIGVIDAAGAANGTDDFFYIAWIIGHFGSYAHPCEESGLSYQMEYILKGHNNDKENLSAVIGDLMLLRQAVNMAYLLLDPEKSSELTTLSAIIGAVLWIPIAEPIIKAVLASLWGYVESLVDVRALLSGYKVAIAKTRETWQTDPEEIAQSGLELDGMMQDAPGGLSYEDYLGTFILVLQRKHMTSRAMDMVESTIRGMGRSDFRLDACIAAISVEMQIRSENRVSFPVKGEISYLDL